MKTCFNIDSVLNISFLKIFLKILESLEIFVLLQFWKIAYFIISNFEQLFFLISNYL